MDNGQEKMNKIISLAKRRGFIYPGSEIYGGLQNAWDFGPLGTELKMNIKAEWWNRFVRRREDMVGVDTALIMNNKVWEASGHLANFNDPLSECEDCHERFRTDQLENDKCPNCGGKLMESRQFNMMLKTYLGATEDKESQVYFRPETAQGMFVNFGNVVDSLRTKLPFGIAQIGKAFRNEITPGNYIFRTREFEQMEIEYFISVPKKDAEWQETFESWREEMKSWIAHTGIKKSEIHELEVPKEELAHYSKRTIDFEYDFPFGRKELYGLAYRTDFDLKNHGLKYRNPETGEEFVPHVIEPTFGVERTILAAMCSAYAEEKAPTAEEGETDTRVVLKFPDWLAPVKVAVLPLSKKEELSEVSRKLAADLRKDFAVMYDETQSIGKRYRRQDEIGTPYCVTVDFDSLKDGKATVRDRDTMKQERMNMSEIPGYLRKAFGQATPPVDKTRPKWWPF
ncbi:MAG: glycine--tRNA ligase [Parcubacteria group bacterium]